MILMDPLLLLIYLLIYLSTEYALLGSRRRWFDVNMGFDDEDRISVKNVYILKVMEQKNFVRSFRIKVGDCRDRAARNWHNGKMKWQH